MARPDLDQRSFGSLHGIAARQEGRAQRRHLNRRQVPRDPAFLRQIGDPLGPTSRRQGVQIIARTPEPIAGLDPDAQRLVLERLRARADAGSGVLVSLHDLTLAAGPVRRLDPSAVQSEHGTQDGG